ASATERISMVEAAEKHGLSRPLRQAIYGFFDRFLAERKGETDASEVAVKPRSPKELLVCKDGQVNETFHSRHLLTLALEEFERRPKPVSPASLAKLLRLDPKEADYRIHEIASGDSAAETLVVCVNGNESRPWQEERAFLDAVKKQGCAVVIIDPRGV